MAASFVNQAAPVIAWHTPAPHCLWHGGTSQPRKLGCHCSPIRIPDHQLSGTFVYTPGTGTAPSSAATTILTATFTPMDTTDFATVEATSVTLVSRLTPTNTWRYTPLL